MIIFIYLNLITVRFEDKSKIIKSTKFNPNLLKIFLRYYPDLAEEFAFDCNSESEDYQYEQKDVLRNYQLEMSRTTLPKDCDFVAQKDFPKREKQQIFEIDNQELNLDNKFEFPELVSSINKKSQIPLERGVQ